MPAPAQRPVETEAGGIRYVDPFLWLEEETEEVLAWQRSESAATVASLQASPTYAEVLKGLDEWFVVARLTPPSRSGKWWLEVAVAPGSDRACLCASDADLPVAPGRPILDPSTLLADGRIDWFSAAPDGSLVAVGISERGDEQSVIHVVDPATGEVLPDRLPFCSFGTVVWDPDGRGFYYTAGKTRDDDVYQKLVWHHRLGEAPPSEPLPMEFDDAFIEIHGSPDDRYLAVKVREVAPRADWLLDRSTGEWRRLVPAGPDGLVGVFRGDEYLAVTTEGNPKGRLVRIPLATSTDSSTWVNVAIPEHLVVEGVRDIGGTLVVEVLDDAQSSLLTIDATGAVATIDLPRPGSATLGAIADGGSQVALTVSTLVSSPALHILDVTSRQLTEVRPAARSFHGAEIERLHAVSADGTRVPYFLLRPAGAPTRPETTVMWAYGGFNIPALPGYRPEIPTLLSAGINYVFTNIRGGGEFGRDWWEAARFANRHRSYEDVAAIARDLVDRGVTTAPQLGLYGASNGGLMAACMVVREPSLFGAVVSLVPPSDLLRGDSEPYVAHDMHLEFGDATKPEDAAWLLTYSPYHNVPESARFPATLVICGQQDIRCPPWHARKLVARLLAAHTGSAPIQLRVWDNAGHLPSSSRTENLTRQAEWLSFLLSHTQSS